MCEIVTSDRSGSRYWAVSVNVLSFPTHTRMIYWTTACGVSFSLLTLVVQQLPLVVQPLTPVVQQLPLVVQQLPLVQRYRWRFSS